MLRFVLVCCLIVFVCSCTGTAPKPQKSQLQIREMQTRYFDTTDVKLAMKAVLDTLQDLDFSISNVNIDLGFLNGYQEEDIENRTTAALFSMGMGTSRGGTGLGVGASSAPTWKKNKRIDVSVNVTLYGEQVKVRASFQEKIRNNLGGTMSVGSIDDPKYYQTFFSKVSKSIFYKKEDL